MNENFKRFVPLIMTLFVVLCVLIGIVYLVKTYQHIQSTNKAYENHMEKFVKTEFNLKNMHDFTLYTDEKSYEIAKGEVDNESVVIFNPIKNDNKEKAIVFKQADFVNLEQMQEAWKNACDVCKLKKSSIAMIDEEPVWEFTYLDSQNRYVLEYISLLDGEMYERIKLQK